MIKIIDTRGYSCPEPVLMVKKEVDSSIQNELTVITDAGTPRENVKRFAEHSRYLIMEEVFEDGFKLNLKK